MITAVNDMQARIAALLKGRTMMLGAISHDLKTYITRLRLRPELIGDNELQTKTVRDLDDIAAVIDDALAVAKVSAVSDRHGQIDLARKVGLSAPSVAERVKRLEERGVIRGYAAQINPEALGFGLAIHIRIRPMPGQLTKLAALLNMLDAIVECDRVTGDDCFVAKAHVASVQELEALIDQIIPLGGTNTAIIQSSPVERRLPRIPVVA